MLMPDQGDDIRRLSTVLSQKGIRSVTVGRDSSSPKETTKVLGRPWKEQHDTYITTALHWPSNVPLVRRYL